MADTLCNRVEQFICYLEDLKTEILNVNKPLIKQMAVKSFENWKENVTDTTKIKRIFANFLCFMDFIRFYSDGVIYDAEQLAHIPPSFVLPANTSFLHPRDGGGLNRGIGLSAASIDGYEYFHRQLKKFLKENEVIIYYCSVLLCCCAIHSFSSAY